MAHSGLFVTLEVVYGSNAVVHMLTGKAISRASRGNFLVDAALNIMLFALVLHMAFPATLPEISEEDIPSEVSDDFEDDTDEKCRTLIGNAT